MAENRFVNFNGNIYPEHEPLLPAHNRSFKYGDGLFETIKVINGEMQLEQFHFDRLFGGAEILQIIVKGCFDKEVLKDALLHLCSINQCIAAAKVRLAVFRNNEGYGEYLIEALPLPNQIINWEAGNTIDIYPLSFKAPGPVSNIKTANFLIYVLASLYAKQKGLDDCIVLNTSKQICDSTKANIFLVKNGEIYTPATDQGCISGVMRRFIIEELKRMDIFVLETMLTVDDLYQADEVFLTNAIIGMQPVTAFREKQYATTQSFTVYKQITSTNLFQQF